MRFQVGSFMEDDIATASIGISLTVPLRIEIFLDLTNVQHNLIEGKVRISTDQGLSLGPGVNIIYPEASEPVVSKPVVGLSCFIPHLVRRYLRSGHIHELWQSKYKFSEGELLTGLMKDVVKALVSLKHTCCVCGEEHNSSKRVFPAVPLPCEKNLCQALFATWLAVAPLKILPMSEFHKWLKKSFDEDSDMLTVLIKSYARIKFGWLLPIGYEAKILHLANTLIKTEVEGSWLKLTVQEPENDGEEDSENTNDDSRKRKASGHGERALSPVRQLPYSRSGRPYLRGKVDQDSSENDSELATVVRRWRPTNSGSNDLDLEFGRVFIKEENMVDTATRTTPSERSSTIPKIQKTRHRGLFFTSSVPRKQPPLCIFPENDEEETATPASTSRLTGHAKDKNHGD